MSKRGEVLVAIINNFNDFADLRDHHWYRIPIISVEKWLKDRFPPEWIAFYQTKKFGAEAYAVNYIVKVLEVKQVIRQEIFPDEPISDKTNKKYYQLIVSPLQPLDNPIVSKRNRRIVFIPTTMAKVKEAEEINDLYDDSPLEDSLWTELKKLEIPAERQEFIEVGSQEYALDFSVYCSDGKIDIESDGDYWHSHPDKKEEDTRRSNDLQIKGWHVIRFTSHQIREEMSTYCVDKIEKMVDRLGGLDIGKFKPRKFGGPKGIYQPSLFDPPEDD
jgi:very-short-patch-repair endonuclease